MTTAATETSPTTLAEQWRFDQAVKMGFSPALADEVMRHAEVDLHQLNNMLQAGCPHELAYEILRS